MVVVKPTEGVKGVKINCQGDMDVFGVEKYTPIDIPLGNSVFEEGTSPSIPSLLGLDLLIRKFPSEFEWSNSSAYSFVNFPATFLNLRADLKDRSWGWAPMQWQSNVGSAVVLRADHKPITPKQVEALCHYCQFILQPEFENANTLSEHPDRTRLPKAREEVNAKFITKDAFRDFFGDYQKKKAEKKGLEAWAEEVFPCDI